MVGIFIAHFNTLLEGGMFYEKVRRPERTITVQNWPYTVNLNSCRMELPERLELSTC